MKQWKLVSFLDSHVFIACSIDTMEESWCRFICDVMADRQRKSWSSIHMRSIQIKVITIIEFVTSVYIEIYAYTSFCCLAQKFKIVLKFIPSSSPLPPFPHPTPSPSHTASNGRWGCESLGTRLQWRYTPFIFWCPERSCAICKLYCSTIHLCYHGI